MRKLILFTILTSGLALVGGYSQAATCSFNASSGTLTLGGSGTVSETCIEYALDDYDSDDILHVVYTDDANITSIGKEAFWAASNLTSMNIPDSVTSIGKNAFSKVNLSELTVNETNLQKYLSASGKFIASGDINISCTVGNCKQVLEDWDEAKGTNYASRLVLTNSNNNEGLNEDIVEVIGSGEDSTQDGNEGSNGTENIIETPTAPARADIRIYTIEEANRVAGKVNRVSITYR